MVVLMDHPQKVLVTRHVASHGLLEPCDFGFCLSSQGVFMKLQI